LSRLYNRIILLILATILIASCTPESTTISAAPVPTIVIPALTSTPTTVPPTYIAPTAVLTNAPTTIAPTVLPPAEPSPERSNRMKTRIKIKDRELTATLIDSKATQDFLAQLPLTLTLEDYAGTEKINYLPKRLSTEGAPSGSDPSIGDIAYYAPWGNLAIYYRDSGYANGLVILGKIDGGIGTLQAPGSVSAIIEQID
jgi:hypothetical protein